jgi:hypothetical protein
LLASSIAVTNHPGKKQSKWFRSIKPNDSENQIDLVPTFTRAIHNLNRSIQGCIEEFQSP